MVGIIFRCMHSFVRSVLEGRELVYFVGYFNGTGYAIGGLCVGIGVRGNYDCF